MFDGCSETFFCCIILDFIGLLLLNRMVLEWLENFKCFWKHKTDKDETTLSVTSSFI